MLNKARGFLRPDASTVFQVPIPRQWPVNGRTGETVPNVESAVSEIVSSPCVGPHVTERLIDTSMANVAAGDQAIVSAGVARVLSAGQIERNARLRMQSVAWYCSIREQKASPVLGESNASNRKTTA